MSRRQDCLLGNILLDDYLYSKRSPPFLNRNLNRVFWVHQYILENGNTEGIRDSYHEFRSQWRPPSWDTLDSMIALENSRGSFRLDVHGFKPLNPNLAFVRDGPQRKVRNLFSIRSKIQATVHSESSALPRKSLRAQEATVAGKDSNHSTKATVDTDSMAISRGDLSVDENENGLIFDKCYKLTLSINFSSSQDADELYKHMGYDTTRRSISARLTTSYGNILNCPEGFTVMPLTASKEKLNFGIEVSMYWSDTRDESILSASNRQQRSLATPVSYPSPPIEREPKFAVTFVYAEEKGWRSGLGCPHCHTREFPVYNQFYMHIISFHSERFKYQAFNDGEDDAGVIRLRFETHQPHHKVEIAQSLSGDRFDNYVMAPARPFDYAELERNSDQSWQWEATTPAVPSMPATPATAARPAILEIVRAPLNDNSPLRRKPPEQVQDIPVRQKRTFRVPKAPPGVTFFRSFSKRPLTEGEEIDESDDDVDMEWTEARKAAEMEKKGLISDSMKRFLSVYDKYMSEEGVQSERCLGDALVRFVRQNAAWVWQQDVFDDFKVKIDELREDDIITELVHSWCIETVESERRPDSQDATDLTQRLAELDVQPVQTSSSSDITSQSPARRRVDKGKGKAKVTDTGHLTPITADSDGDIEMREVMVAPSRPSTAHQQQSQVEIEDPPYDLCLCGQDAQVTARVLPVIACSGVDCVRRYFHLDCVKHNSCISVSLQDTKKRTWICDECGALTNRLPSR